MAAYAAAGHTAVMNSPTVAEVFIVDDSPMIRTSLRDLLADIDGVQIVGEAETVVEAIDGILQLRPRCVVLDFRLKGGTGVDVLRAVHPVAPDIGFIVLTNHATPQYRRLCLGAGAKWFFDKSTELAKIKGAVLDCAAAKQLSAALTPPYQG
jgi:DNA-binding NarL/FixJ family response regulator